MLLWSVLPVLCHRGRSGNRGLCAQPCRLAYGWGDRADSHPLSLKDMSLATHLHELNEMGVACAKIEGRMKRPEYVWVVTKVYADALREGRDPTAQELRALEEAFSRQGFTDGYYMRRKGQRCSASGRIRRSPASCSPRPVPPMKRGRGPACR